MDINKILEKLDELNYTQVESYLAEQLNVADQEKDFGTKISLLNEMIGFCRDSCQFDKTRSYSNELLSLLEKENLVGTQAYATSLLNIANADRASGDLEESLSYYKEAYRIYEKLLSPKDFLFASLNNNMALLYQEKNDYASACECLKKALEIVLNNPEAIIESAISYTNLAQSLIRLNRMEEASEYIGKALKIFIEDGERDYHYSASLSVYAEILYHQGRYTESVKYYDKALNEFEKHMGKGGNYQVILENRNQAFQMAKKEGNAVEPKTTSMTDKQKMSGLELCERYYNQYGKDMIHNKFPEYEHMIAVGMVGEGSECFGFDDEYSRDHDWGPGFCMWLSDDLYHEIGKSLQRAYDELPKSLDGYERFTTKQGSHRTGVFCIQDFYQKFIPSWTRNKEMDWQNTEEDNLATVTNGKVFRDDLGEFSKVRENLLSYYPDTIWKKKLGISLIQMAKSGQYNFGRMKKRNDYVTAQIYLAEYFKWTMQSVYLLNRVYAPYEKWLLKGIQNLSILPEVGDILRAISDMELKDERIEMTIEIIAQLMIDELEKQNLIQNRKNSDDAYYLEPYGQMLLKEDIMEQEEKVYTQEELVEKLVKLEWEAFDQVKNEGGRASCQDNWNTFSIMRKSQYLTWTEEMLLSYLNDFYVANEKGWNLITEKYGRMMESTAPDRFEEIKDSLPLLSDEKKQIIEEIVRIQVSAMEEMAKKYPLVADTARSIHTSEDTTYETSYETYLRGEISTYSDQTLMLYGRYLVELSNKEINPAMLVMEKTALLYGYSSLDDLEERLKNGN